MPASHKPATDFALTEQKDDGCLTDAGGTSTCVATLPLRLTTYELAAFWRVSPRTIERWSATGRCPAPLRIGGRVLFRREEVLAWETERQKARGD
jgi:excisionase family DNA binding protein